MEYARKRKLQILQFKYFDAGTFAANHKLMARLKYFSALVVITVFFSDLFPAGAVAQDNTKALHLDEAIATAVNNNSSVRIRRFKV